MAEVEQPPSSAETAECKNCGEKITTWHPYPQRLPREWTHADTGHWDCADESGTHAEPRP